MKAKVFVTLKEGVLDPQGQAVGRTLKRLGYDEVDSVRIGKFVEVELNSEDPNKALERLTLMCERLIANTVIENFRIELDEEGAAG